MIREALALDSLQALISQAVASSELSFGASLISNFGQKHLSLEDLDFGLFILFGSSVFLYICNCLLSKSLLASPQIFGLFGQPDYKAFRN